MADWQRQQQERQARLDEAGRYARGKVVAAKKAKGLLEAAIRSGDRACLEGNNQRQADFLAEILASVDRSRIHDLHLVQSGIVLPAHLDLFERGEAPSPSAMAARRFAFMAREAPAPRRLPPFPAFTTSAYQRCG